jgi:hypothetical protein
MALPVAGAVHRYQTERLAATPACLGSPASAVASWLRPPIELLGPGRNWANWKLSFEGAASAGDGIAIPPLTTAAARTPVAARLRRDVDMLLSLRGSGRAVFATAAVPTCSGRHDNGPARAARGPEQRIPRFRATGAENPWPYGVETSTPLTDI